jgi:TolA-binding protein
MRFSEVKLPLLMLFLCGASASWGGDYLYTPQPVSGAAGEGVLVREVTVKKGDTLSHLSKQFSGRGHYYPQILLFNEIKNPHRIHPGQVVRVPLARNNSQPATDDNAASKVTAEVTAVVMPKKAHEKQKPAVQRTVRKGEHKAYTRAVAAFKKGNCTTAITLFDDFIRRYPSSGFVPEATLNRAECYLKLSEK